MTRYIKRSIAYSRHLECANEIRFSPLDGAANVICFFVVNSIDIDKPYRLKLQYEINFPGLY